jgi:hypothetical protein
MDYTLKQSKDILHIAKKLTGEKNLVKILLVSICAKYIDSDTLNITTNPYILYDKLEVESKLSGYVKILKECQYKGEQKEYIPISQYKIYIDTVIDVYNWMIEKELSHKNITSVCIEILKSPNRAAILIGTLNSLKNHHKQYITGKRIMLLNDNCKIVTCKCWNGSNVGIVENDNPKIKWVSETTKVRVL